jgi:hypothetical protein
MLADSLGTCGSVAPGLKIYKTADGQGVTERGNGHFAIMGEGKEIEVAAEQAGGWKPCSPKPTRCGPS